MQGKETCNRNQISQWGCYTPSLSGWFQLLQTFHIFPVCFLGRGWAEAGLHIRDLKGSHFQTVQFLLADQFGGEKTGSCWLSTGGELGFCGKFSPRAAEQATQGVKNQPELCCAMASWDCHVPTRLQADLKLEWKLGWDFSHLWILTCVACYLQVLLSFRKRISRGDLQPPLH